MSTEFFFQNRSNKFESWRPSVSGRFARRRKRPIKNLPRCGRRLADESAQPWPSNSWAARGGCWRRGRGRGCSRRGRPTAALTWRSPSRRRVPTAGTFSTADALRRRAESPKVHGPLHSLRNDRTTYIIGFDSISSGFWRI